MIDIDKAKSIFEEYISKYDLNNDAIKLKIKHTYCVIEVCEYICNDLKLDKEDKDLAILISLLHDIGRFEQLKIYNTFLDYMSIDHALLGIKILFDDNLIRKFILSDKYDEIIKKSILNHNKYCIDESEMTETELLHCKIIRDADKLDNFRVKLSEKFETLFKINDISNELISEEIYNDFLNHKLIKAEERKSHLDMWISYIAFIFDCNFKSSYKYVYENDYINRMIDLIDYKQKDTIEKMRVIRKVVNEYIDNKIID